VDLGCEDLRLIIKPQHKEKSIMAKKIASTEAAAQSAGGTPTAPANEKNAQAAAARAAKTSQLAKQLFKHTGAEPKEKLAPQAMEIIAIIKEAGEPITREDVVKRMDGRVKTRQPQERILTYYVKALIASAA
jgi:hypothetical protein